MCLSSSILLYRYLFIDFRLIIIMLHLVAILFFINVLQVTSFGNEPLSECTQELVYSQTCLWYPHCLEDKYNCGKKGYPMEYGFKYCNKFGQLKTYPEARLWIQKTTVCLKERLLFTLKDDTHFSCHQLRNVAFDTHPFCYSQAGFCQLFKELGVEKSAIFLKQLVGIFQVKDFQSISAVKQIEQMAKECLKRVVMVE